MKILVTGMTSRHVGSDRIKLSYAQATDALVKLLRSVPENVVEHRPVKWGENLDSFDVILTGVHKIGTMAVVVKNLLGVAWAANHWLPKIVPFYDDWSAMNTIGGAQTLIRTWAKRMAFYQSGCPMTLNQEIELKAYVELIATGQKFGKGLIPAFPWADEESLISKFPASDEALCWDPTPFSDVFSPTPFDKRGPREKKWVLATLQDHQSWVKKMNFSWPVDEFGVKSLGQLKQTEYEIRMAYHSAWGVLAPKYPAPGWWRARFYHAAEAGAVLLVDSADARDMGPVTTFPSVAWKVEQMSEVELTELAALQRAWITERVTNPEITATRVMNLLRS